MIRVPHPVRCVMKDCDLPVLTLHLCNKHWRRLRKYGSPDAVRARAGLVRGRPLEERFWIQVKKTPECWLWAGPTDKDGYGVFRGEIKGNIYTKAHRFSLALTSREPLPIGMVVMHVCDNPRCVNPAHLRLATSLENVLDKHAKGRAGLPKGSLLQAVVLSASQRRAIISDPRPDSQVAADYGINRAAIAEVRSLGTQTGHPVLAGDDRMPCAIKDCTAPSAHLGLCAEHWRRCTEFGAPTIDKPHLGKWIALPVRDRLMARIREDEGCWMWTGFTDKDGYGRMRAKIGKIQLLKAHTVSYTVHTGELVPKGMVLMHTCDRPGCINPEHLRVGTYKENSRDMHVKGRARDQKGEKGSKAKISEADAAAILRDVRPYDAIAKHYGIAASTVGSIKQRKSWQFIRVSEVAKAKRIGMRGERQWAAKLTEADVIFIRSSRIAGKDLAAKFSVTPQAITNIRKRRIWKHVR